MIKQPAVVLVGHIDHGKSSLLESIKNLGVLEKESGGITQHISAYEIEHDGKSITFIDTPGHAAFTAMRARGADISDIAILVIAGDEGVMPQTKEAIKHLKASETPFIVAVNKMDKTGVSSEKIKGQLVEEGVEVEDRGGEVPLVEVSAETGKGVDDLLDVLALLVEMNGEEVSNICLAKGWVIDSYVSSQKGSVATLLIQEGVLREGDIVGTGSSFGRIKRMENFLGERLKEAGPGKPVQVLGFNEVPQAGEAFSVFSSLDEAKEGIQEDETIEEVKSSGAKRTLNIVVKVDVMGSLEPVKGVLKALPQDKVSIHIVHSGVGDVSINDVKRAETCDAVVLGFNTTVSSVVKKEAKRARVQIFSFDVIYELRKGMVKIMESVLGPQKVRVNLAKLKALVIFKTDRRQVVGAKVLKGEVKKGYKIEVFKEEKVKAGEGVGQGRVVGLQQNKREIKSGKEGNEIGMLYEGKGENIEEGDTLVAYEIREKMPSLE